MKSQEKMYDRMFYPELRKLADDMVDQSSDLLRRPV
jgi:hypothetical protein